MTPRHAAPADATVFDWILLGLIIAIGGSSFAMIRSAVETVPPAAVTVIRLWIGAIFLYIVMKQAKRKLPSLFVHTPDGRVIHHEWRWMIGISLVGYVAPFFIFPWAQQYIDSGLAGIYMAFMPIWTIVLAYFFAGESLTLRKGAGFFLGFIGVIILMGPELIGNVKDADLVAQIAVLAATICYAIFAILTRRAPPIRPRVFAAGTLLSAAIISTPALFLTNLNVSQWTFVGVLNVIGLGLGPTGLAGLILIILIQRAGAGFMALANYMMPLWAVAMGAALFDESLKPTALLALAIILAGVAISQRAATTKTPMPVK